MVGQNERTRPIGYARVSTERQSEQGTSLDGQRSAIERFCAERGLGKPRLEVEVEGAGEERQERRLVLRRIMRELRAGDVIVVWKLDRFSRDTRFTLDAIEQLRVAGAKLLSVTENIDPDTPDGYLFLTILAGFARREKEKILERTIGRRRALRIEGKFVEGIPPLGYVVEKRKLVIEPIAAEAVRCIFAKSIGGSSLREMSAWLEESIGRRFGPSAIAYMLRNRVYLGQQETEAREAGPGRRRVGSGEWIDTHDRIVDPVTFARSAKASAKRRKLGRPLGNGITADWLLRGLAVCKMCGSKLSAKAYTKQMTPRPKHAGWYVCRRRVSYREREGETRCALGPLVRRDDLDAKVKQRVTLELADTQSHFEQPPVARVAAPLIDWVAKRAALEKRRARVVEAFASGDMAKSDMRAALARLDASAIALDVSERDALDVVPIVDTAPARRKAVAAVKNLVRLWTFGSANEQRGVLLFFVEKIEVDANGDPDVTWRNRDALFLAAKQA